MDILTHTLSGVAIGIVISGFSTRGFPDRLSIIALGGLGGALPDLDAISLWSGFDSTIGDFFKLSNSGKEIYFSQFWYSHHGFLHSLMASLIFCLLMCLTFYVKEAISKRFSIINLWNEIKIRKLILISFASGFIIHLIEDMVTPACVWSGVNFFWPFKTYIGGSGDIWWWNNYDIFLIIIAVILINLIVLSLNQIVKVDLRKIAIIIFLTGFTLSVYQIKTRGFNFNYIGHTSKYQEYEIKSKEIQKQILGEKIFLIMEDFDNRLKFNF
ncbi:MAG: metal-dependent hydrolase [Bacteroidota bacterium]|nr:metal-dependent hydrolase [Bacteroidota bacterium]